MSEHLLFFNGISESGEYLRQPRSVNLQEPAERTPRAVIDRVDVKDLGQSGWGILFAHGDARQDAIREALQPLLDHRRQQAAAISELRYQEYVGERGYSVSGQDFLERQQTAPGLIDPDRVPYYLLIVGDPKSVPFTFQYQLDVPCAVGRIHFETLDEYAQYARTVVEAETRPAERPRKAVFFGPQHKGDPATDISICHLLLPLRDQLRKWQGWDMDTLLGEDATKAQLSEVLGGRETPSVLFTGGHGMGFSCGGSRQKPYQGALLCQDWMGPRSPAPPSVYFSADDLADSVSLRGLISFHFACYSAGTPSRDGFSDKPSQIAPEPFLARLPQRMLALPRGGALAVIGHVDQACQSSFLWKTAGSQVLTFASSLLRLEEGYPVGAALEPLNQRYSQLTAEHFSAQENGEAREVIDFLRLAIQDARNYVVVGDPAVRLPSAAVPAPKPPVTRGAA